jgi:hypothetical protein
MALHVAAPRASVAATLQGGVIHAHVHGRQRLHHVEVLHVEVHSVAEAAEVTQVAEAHAAEVAEEVAAVAL